jgi:hypothetical protein
LWFFQHPIITYTPENKRVNYKKHHTGIGVEKAKCNMLVYVIASQYQKVYSKNIKAKQQQECWYKNS